MEFAVEPESWTCSDDVCIPSGQHVVHGVDIRLLHMQRGFGGDRAFDEFARPQQLERTFDVAAQLISEAGFSVT